MTTFTITTFERLAQYDKLSSVKSGMITKLFQLLIFFTYSQSFCRVKKPDITLNIGNFLKQLQRSTAYRHAMLFNLKDCKKGKINFSFYLLKF